MLYTFLLNQKNKGLGKGFLNVNKFKLLEVDTGWYYLQGVTRKPSQIDYRRTSKPIKVEQTLYLANPT